MKRFAAILLALICLAGSASAADTSEIRGYLKGEDYQYILLGSYPYEEDGTVAPLLWRFLWRDGDTTLLFTEYIIDVHQVMEVDNYKDMKNHKFARNLEFSQTDLYTWLNGEMSETIFAEQDFSAAIIPPEDGGLFTILHNTELRNKDYGFPNTTYGTTIEQPGEKAIALAKNRMGYATPYAKAHVLYDDWEKQNRKSLYVASYGASAYWTRQMRSEYTGIVGANGHLSWAGCGDVQKGVRPAVWLDVSKIQLTGGSGTLDDPWTAEVIAE